MKKLLLLSALFVFACSSDDNSDTNDSSNQNFLEKYDGVIWKDADDTDGYYIDFNPIGYNECVFEGGFYYSGSTIWGEVNDGDWVVSVVENSTERLVIEYTETNDFGQTYSYLVEIDAINNGDRIEVEQSDTTVIEYYDRVSNSPCN